MIRRFLQNTAVVVISIVVAIGMGEAAFRLLAKNTGQQYSVAPTGNQYDFYQFDELLGWSNAQGMHGVYQRDEFRYEVSINQYGMRQGDVALTPRTDVLRIAFLGDSFVWGIGVSDRQRFTDIVGRIPGVEALNFAVSGYAPIQYYLMIDKIISFLPNLVVIAFCSNDFSDNVLYQRYGYYKPYAILDEHDDIVIKGYPIKNVKKFGAQNYGVMRGWLGQSLLVKTAMSYINQKRAASDQRGLIGFESIYQYSDLDEQRKLLRDISVRTNEKLIEKIKQKLDKAGIPLVIITAPTKFEYNPSGQYGNFVMDNQVGDILAKMAAERDIDLINTIPLLDGYDFWVRDGHWNPRGHEKMAAAMVDYLVSADYIASSGVIP